MARSTKFTDAVKSSLLALLAEGNTRRAAANVCGIEESTLKSYIRRNASFASEVKKAEDKAETVHVANIARSAASGQWQASAWWLERKRPDDWGRRERIDITHVVRQEAERLAQQSGLDPEALIREAERILAAGA